MLEIVEVDKDSTIPREESNYRASREWPASIKPKSCTPSMIIITDNKGILLHYI
jgi:hypothetical protein